ncbi:MAG: hypothetical protein HY654_03775 [Acidobacteria bacterium]|nr:hypothetical protein [Acidobacteriota bacterium]
MYAIAHRSILLTVLAAVGASLACRSPEPAQSTERTVTIYVSTGLPKAGDRIDDVRLIDKASPWSFSLVFVVPVAPF